VGKGKIREGEKKRGGKRKNRKGRGRRRKGKGKGRGDDRKKGKEGKKGERGAEDEYYLKLFRGPEMTFENSLQIRFELHPFLTNKFNRRVFFTRERLNVYQQTLHGDDVVQ